MDDDCISLGAILAEREQNGALWSARDVLRDCLKRIDDGDIEADAVVVVWRNKKRAGLTATHFAQCGPDVHTTLGLLSYAAQQIYSESDDRHR
jgi:hypothetical protein